MTKLFLGFFISLLGAVSFHNFYVSTTSIRFVPDEKSLQITTQVFLDDFESVLQQNGHEKTKLIPEVGQEEIDILVEDYFRKNITLLRNLEYDNNQVTAGQTLMSIKFSANYNLSKNLTSIFFYDHNFSEFAISTAFPQTSIRSGITIRYNFGN